MINLSPEFCKRIKEERRKAALTQTELAREVGCKQSALSMFEQGDGTKLNDDVIEKIARKFGIALVRSSENTGSVPTSAPAAGVPSPAHKAFCPNPACPSQQVYFVEERKLVRPDRDAQDPAGGKFCAICGELLERRCPSCGAAVHAGAICTFCGEPYIAVI